MSLHPSYWQSASDVQALDWVVGAVAGSGVVVGEGVVLVVLETMMPVSAEGCIRSQLAGG